MKRVLNALFSKFIQPQWQLEQTTTYVPVTDSDLKDAGIEYSVVCGPPKITVVVLGKEYELPKSLEHAFIKQEYKTLLTDSRTDNKKVLQLLEEAKEIQNESQEGK